VEVVSLGAGVRSSIRFPRSLQPEVGVNDVDPRVLGAGGGSNPKPGVVDVTPVAAVFPHVGHTITRGINHITFVSNSCTPQRFGKHVNINHLVDGFVVLGFQVAWVISAGEGAKGLVVGSVGSKSTNLVCTTGRFQDFGENLGNFFGDCRPSLTILRGQRLSIEQR